MKKQLIQIVNEPLKKSTYDIIIEIFSSTQGIIYTIVLFFSLIILSISLYCIIKRKDKTLNFDLFFDLFSVIMSSFFIFITISKLIIQYNLISPIYFSEYINSKLNNDDYKNVYILKDDKKYMKKIKENKNILFYNKNKKILNIDAFSNNVNETEKDNKKIKTLVLYENKNQALISLIENEKLKEIKKIIEIKETAKETIIFYIEKDDYK